MLYDVIFMPEVKVKVYSTPTCPYCSMAKEFLKQHNVDFLDVDVSKDQQAAQEMIRKSGQMGVPVIEINGNIVVGFDKQKLRKLLNL